MREDTFFPSVRAWLRHLTAAIMHRGAIPTKGFVMQYHVGGRGQEVRVRERAEQGTGPHSVLL